MIWPILFIVLVFLACTFATTIGVIVAGGRNARSPWPALIFALGSVATVMLGMWAGRGRLW